MKYCFMKEIVVHGHHKLNSVDYLRRENIKGGREVGVI